MKNNKFIILSLYLYLLFLLLLQRNFIFVTQEKEISNSPVPLFCSIFENGTLINPVIDGYELASIENSDTCEDINECQREISGCSQLCHNTIGSFECSCQPGYTLDVDKKGCAVLIAFVLDIDECNDGGGCEHICSNLMGSFECLCNPGYTLDGDKMGCIDIDECLAESSGCAHYCKNLNGSFECSCGSRFALNDDKKGCTDITFIIVWNYLESFLDMLKFQNEVTSTTFFAICLYALIRFIAKPRVYKSNLAQILINSMASPFRFPPHSLASLIVFKTDSDGFSDLNIISQVLGGSVGKVIKEEFNENYYTRQVNSGSFTQNNSIYHTRQWKS
ncbi:hypothetical protein DICPUDRAFT_152664 [Dictyostelium purpureum]|uniref:EGF-like domain-containing protein n=1 Tax=Dictyostelium purpureum TaxID=5786 RepID=F0ZLZ3_DICPU|nr:uncharacterized protein DICPUDRAFT_152664 [Dictyostelium purpureum]EGC35069.1 hypothetical protein DICPUDRAFT_152664 [Dictyostelium purpureum]|eukprot:XP_003288437.1 hypothetical protein DICPUDRAFT_152664 [Dictyostelium purpureum]